MSLTTETATMVYELTVAGALGPAVKAVLQPLVTASAELQTILRAEVPPDVDLVDLVRILDALGVEFADITTVPDNRCAAPPVRTA